MADGAHGARPSPGDPEPSALLAVVAAALRLRHHVIVGIVDRPVDRPECAELEVAVAEAGALHPADRVHQVSGTRVEVAVSDPVAVRAGNRFDAFVEQLTTHPVCSAVVVCCEVRDDETAVALLARLAAGAERRLVG